MSLEVLLHKLGVLIGALMVIAGVVLSFWLLARIPGSPGLLTAYVPAAQARQEIAQPIHEDAAPSPISPLAAAQSPLSQAATAQPIVALEHGLPAQLTQALAGRSVPIVALASASAQHEANLILSYNPDDNPSDSVPVFRQIFAVADSFDTVNTSIRWPHVQEAWQGVSSRYRSVAILEESLPALQAILGPAGPGVLTYPGVEEILDALTRDPYSLAYLPFDKLTPQFVVYDIDGLNPVENDARFDAAAYPFAATVYARAQEALPAELLAALPATNRDPQRLTVVAMTGVTAMARLTAAQMDQLGSAWPAEVIGPELSQADLTVISNEVSFAENCETVMDLDNLAFCSKPEYLDALLAVGADLIGLTGNHLNDCGPEAALYSLDIYTNAGLRFYGGGANLTAALEPLLVEHNGNRLAFLGANSYGPPSAWAGDFWPGSAPFDLGIMSAAIRNLKDSRQADVVLAELQYLESYDTEPLADQRLDFRALARAGADIVTGVQSHVPQAIERLDGKLILYGLGNLFFDQMSQLDTRQGLIVKHTIYEGRHLSTQLRPTMLYEYGQPRWASPVQRAAILEKVFAASVSE